MPCLRPTRVFGCNLIAAYWALTVVLGLPLRAGAEALSAPWAVRVVAYKSNKYLETGVVVDTAGHVIVPSGLVAGAERVAVLRGGVGPKFELPTSVVGADNGIAILQAVELGTGSVTFARGAPVEGSEVVTVAYAVHSESSDKRSNRPRVVSGRIRRLAKEALPGIAVEGILVEHTATLQAPEVGVGALLNGCSQMIGYNLATRPSEQGGAVALSAWDILVILRQFGITASVSSEACGAVAEASPTPKPAAGGAAEASNDLVKQVQTFLLALGLYDGPVDGRSGAKTIDAVKAFQAKRGLATDGRITTELAQELKSALDERDRKPEPSATDTQVPLPTPTVADSPTAFATSTETAATGTPTQGPYPTGTGDKPEPDAPPQGDGVPPELPSTLGPDWGPWLIGGVVAIIVVAAVLVLALRTRSPGKPPEGSGVRADDLLRHEEVAAGTASDSTWVLSGMRGDGRVIRLVIKAAELMQAHQGLTVGRNQQLADVLLDDPSVSRRHFRLLYVDGGIAIEDLDSKNGTLIDGARLEAFHPIALRPGSRLQVGLVSLDFHRG